MPPDLLNQVAQNGVAFAVLVVAIWYFYRRDVRNEVRAEVREKEIQERCDKERGELSERIHTLEDRHHESSRDILGKVTDALASNSRALTRFCDDHGSGSHKVRGEA